MEEFDILKAELLTQPLEMDSNGILLRKINNTLSPNWCSKVCYCFNIA